MSKPITPVSEDEEKYARFPIPRLLNRRTRARISPSTLAQEEPHRLLCVSNRNGWFSAVTLKDGQYELALSPLSDLRTALLAEDEVQLQPQRVQNLGNTLPISICLAAQDTALLVASQDGRIRGFSTFTLFTAGQNEVNPLLDFSSASPLKGVYPNPSKQTPHQNAVAILHPDGNLEILTITAKSTAVHASSVGAVSWSESGDRLVIGYLDGRISVESFEFPSGNMTQPNRTMFSALHSSPQPVTSIKWLSDQVYHVVCSAQGEASHSIVSVYPSTQSADVVSVSAPFPERQLQCSFIVSLPHWISSAGSSTTGTVLVIGDVGSDTLEIISDIDGEWCQRSPENPLQLPFGDDVENMLLSVEVDLTSQEGPRFDISGEGKDFPPSPILLSYLTDGTIQGWYLAHSVTYPGMVSTSSSTTSQATPSPALQAADTTSSPSPPAVTGNSFSFGASPATPSTPQPAFSVQSTPSQPTPSSTPFGSATSFGTKIAAPAFGQTSFGQPAFGKPTFGQSTFGQPAFGQPAFGQSSFGQPSLGNAASSNTNATPAGGGFAAFSSTPAKFGTTGFGFGIGAAGQTNEAGKSSFVNAASSNASTTPASGGFAAFSSTPAKFGTTGFGFGDSAASKPNGGENVSTPAPALASAPSMAPSLSGMSITEPSVDDLSMGDTPSSSPTKTTSSSPFGSFGSTPSPLPLPPDHPENKPSPFSTPSKPSGGFGAFGGINVQNSPFSKQETGFGAFSGGSGAFGSSPFGQKTPADPSAEKQSTGFGTFSQTPPNTPPAKSPTAFGAFTQTPSGSPPVKPDTGFGAFGTKTSTTPANKPSTGFGAFSNIQSASTTPTSNASPAFEKSAFGTPSFGQPSFGQSSFGKSSFGQSQPTFGQPTLGTPAASAQPKADSTPKSSGSSTSGGFGAFANTTSSFTSLAKASSDNSASGGSVLKSTDTKDGDAAADRRSVFSAPSVFGASFGSSSSPPKPVFATEGSPTLSTPKVKTEDKTESVTSGTKPASSSVFGASFGSPSEPPKSVFGSSSKAPQSVFSLPSPQKSGETTKTKAKNQPEEVEVPEGSDEEQSDEESEEHESDEGSEYIDDGEEDTRSLVSDDFSNISDDLPDEGLSTVKEEDEEDLEDDVSAPPSPSPAAVPLPLSRSASVDSEKIASQRPEPSMVALPPSRSPSIQPEAGLPPSPSRSPFKPEPEGPTRGTSPTTGSQDSTITGGPAKPQSPAPQKPAPVGSAPTTGIGLGRPSTRPSRSSPLASTPFFGTADESEEEETSPQHSKNLSVKASIPSTVEASSGEPASKRPKTPPLLTAFSLTPTPADVNKKGPIFGGFPSQPSPSTSQPVFSLTVPSTPQPSSKTNEASPSTTPTGIAPSGLFSPQANSPFGAGFAMPPKTPIFGGATPSPASLGPSFGKPNFAVQSPAPGPSMFGTPPPSMPTTPQTPSAFPSFSTRPGLGGPPIVPQSSSQGSQSPVAPPEPGLQTECAFLFATLARELEMLKTLAQEASRRSIELSNRDHATQFKKDVGQLKQQLDSFSAEKKDRLRSIEQLKVGLLKATTRREEVVRFVEAKTEGNFAKMLSARTLSPDHLELQTQLRKNIRDVRDRIEKLETHLEGSKVKLKRANAAKAGLKAPSLDTINRTCRNIDIAIGHQAKDIAALTAKVASLNMKASSSKLVERDARLPDIVSKRPLNITPHVAATTAAALNAERSAQKFKHALLASRREPLLNKSAASEPAPPVSFKTPQKAKASIEEGDPDISDVTLNDFGEDKFEVGIVLPTSRRGGTGGTKRHKVIPLKRSPGAPTTPPAAASFNWGPLPSFMASKPPGLGLSPSR